MAEKSQGDVLAQIAARGIQESATLEEQRPPILPDIILPKLLEGSKPAFAPRPPATADSLKAELAEARARMAPFLQDTAPPLFLTRSEILIAQAEWRLEPAETWQTISLPHYGGPIGRARAWYRMFVSLKPEDLRVGSVWVCFGGVDYHAAVFFNGELVGTHEGFFSPFEFEVTDCAREGINELLVRVENDAICMGNRSWDDPRTGDKIYAATGLGWDEPGVGWHHCPPGMGIHRPVRIECRPQVFVADLFVRPLLAENAVEAWIEIFQTQETSTPICISAQVHPANFSDEASAVIAIEDFPAADPGVSRYRLRLPLANARLWTPEEPWMYALQVTLETEKGKDAAATEFGMRSFVLDENPGSDGRRGRFFLNGKPVRLRGANTMGHEQQCVLKGDLDQLRDDILLAKLAHMNFLRFTQRPVEPEVYRLCDRLGMMAQTDLPLFAYLRRNQFSEAVRQASEMERLIRRHPCCILSSFINEPFPASWGDKSHRHLTRPELESFFVAATAAIRVENPDRQIKPIDGDYEPPGPGLPDNHCYTAWYNGHGLEMGKLHKGFWLPVKPGWNYACGEYGSEGLDFEEVMHSRYPASWLPDPALGDEGERAWTPARIHKAQTGGHFHFWFEAGETMAEWIARSQAHQEWATRLMTEAFRRDNRMISFAIHLFIDAWPAGWMKTIMDCRRVPKPAYFAFRNALTPLAVFLRTDRFAYWESEQVEAEVWVCNDRSAAPEGVELAVQVRDGNAVLASLRIPAKIGVCEAVFQGRMVFDLPKLPAGVARDAFRLEAALLNAEGQVLHDTGQDLAVFELLPASVEMAEVMGESGEDVAEYLPADWIVVTDPERLPEALKRVEEGATALLLGWKEGSYDVAGAEIQVEACGMGPRHFVGRDRQHPSMRQFAENDFRFWYDPVVDRPSPLLSRLFFAPDDWRGILHTGQLDWGKAASPAFALAEKPFGRGRILFCQVELEGRMSNPVAALLLRALARMPLT